MSPRSNFEYRLYKFRTYPRIISNYNTASIIEKSKLSFVKNTHIRSLLSIQNNVNTFFTKPIYLLIYLSSQQRWQGPLPSLPADGVFNYHMCVTSSEAIAHSLTARSPRHGVLCSVSTVCRYYTYNNRSVFSGYIITYNIYISRTTMLLILTWMIYFMQIKLLNYVGYTTKITYLWL